MRITGVTCHVLLDPGYDREATSSNQDDIVVEVHTDEGITGIGETDLNAWVARACIESPGTHTMDLGLGQTLVGLDPLDPVAVWEKLYVGTAMTGRRGALVHALGAIDMALWDICGKAAGKPVWQLLGDAAHDAFTPYASLLPNTGGSWDDFAQALVDQAVWAHGLGFRAAKLEALVTGPYAHEGLDVPDTKIVEIIGAVRRAVGADFAIMVDVGYAWSTVGEALPVIESWAEHDVFFVETPLWADDLDGYAALAQRSPIKIAAGEWLATRFEFIDLLDRGQVDVAQPDVGRVGGLTEARRVCELAADRGRLVVPHGWKTGITVAATAQLAAVTANMPFFEFVPQEVAESALRRELVRDELQLEDGRLALPRRPGLGVELDREALERFAAAARTRRGTGGRTPAKASSARVLAAGLDHPEGIALGPDGALYAGGEAGQVYRIDVAAGAAKEIARVEGGFMLGLCADGGGNLYLCDAGNAVVWRLSSDGGLDRYCDSASGTPLRLPNWPAFTEDGRLVVSDSGSEDPAVADGRLVVVPPGGGEGEALDLPPLHFPNGLAVLPDGGLVVLESFSHRLVRIDDGVLREVARFGDAIPDGVAVTADGGFVVSMYYPYEIWHVAADGVAELLVHDGFGAVFPMPTNVCFFGEELASLAVASLGGTAVTAFEPGFRGVPLRYP